MRRWRLHAAARPYRIAFRSRRGSRSVVGRHARSSAASLRDRALWYFNYCKSVAAIKARLPSEMCLDCRHDVLLWEPERTIEEMCRFVGEDAPADYVAARRKAMLRSPRRTRTTVFWDDGLVDEIGRRLVEYDFLAGYNFDD